MDVGYKQYEFFCPLVFYCLMSRGYKHTATRDVAVTFIECTKEEQQSAIQ
jgi:hypothetical protein